MFAPCFRLARRALLGAVGVLLAPALAQATVMQEVPMEEMVATADAVVRGVVVRTGTRVAIVDGALEPQRHTFVEVSEWLVGKRDTRVVELWEPGGTYGDVQVETAGTPRYDVGEEVVVFLRADATHPGLFRTHQMAQGKYRIARPDEGSSADLRGRLAVRDLDEVLFARWTRGRFALAPARPTAETLGTLLARIRAIATRKPAVSPSAGGAR